jgi:hypothetical protein
MSRKYTPKQIEFLKDNVKGRSFAELHKLFNRRFKLSISIGMLRGVCYYYGFSNGAHRPHYTPEELRFIRQNIKGRSYIEMVKLYNKNFRPKITLKQLESLAYKRGLRNGLGAINGFAPPNKGKKHPPWQGNYRPIGTERIINYRDHRKERPYIEIKTDHNKWMRKHTAIWEKANGKVPKGHVVIFADGNNRNFDLDNLLLVSRMELGVMNRCRLISKEKDLTTVGKTVASLKIAIGKRKKKRKSRRNQ